MRVHPKDLYREAQEAEKQGNNRVAANYYISLSEYLLKNGKADQALQLSQHTSLLLPNSNRVLLTRALAEKACGKLDEAKQTLYQILQGTHRFERPLMVLEEIYRAQKEKQNLESLEKLLNQSISMEAFLKEVHPQREPEVRFEQEKEKSLNSLVEALEAEVGLISEPDLKVEESLIVKELEKKEKLTSRDKMDLAVAFAEIDMVRVSRALLETVQDSWYRQAQALLGGLLLETGADLEALEAFQRVLRNNSSQDTVYIEVKYQLAHLYLRLADKQKAAECVAELLAIAPRYRALNELKLQFSLG